MTNETNQPRTLLESMQKTLPGKYRTRTPNGRTELVVEAFGIKYTEEKPEYTETEVSNAIRNYYIQELNGRESKNPFDNGFVLPDGRNIGVTRTCLPKWIARSSTEGLCVLVTVNDLGDKK